MEKIRKFYEIYNLDTDEYKNINIDSADFSVRVNNRLHRAGIETVGALLECTHNKLADLNGFGAGCFKEIYEEEIAMINIRNEKETDYRVVEKIIRKAFYNLYVPGCVEHYLAHIMRSHEDFIPELDFALELDGQVIGNIMYTKAKLVDENGEEKEILTFGPVCISPEYQRMGYGKNLMEYSFEKAKALGYDTIVIFGSPVNYVSRGFESCKKYNVCLENGKYSAAMMVKELVPNVLDGRKWFYYDSPVMAVDEKEAQKYDDTLEEIKKEHRPSQEEFYIMSHSFIE